MGHAQSWHALAAQQSPQFSAKLLPGRRIQRGEGLIEQQESGTAREHTRENCGRSEEHTSELQSPCNLVCRLLLEKKNKLAQQTLLRRVGGTTDDHHVD